MLSPHSHRWLAVATCSAGAQQGTPSAIQCYNVTMVGTPAVPARDTSRGTEGLLSYKCCVKLEWLTLIFLYIDNLLLRCIVCCVFPYQLIFRMDLTAEIERWVGWWWNTTVMFVPIFFKTIVSIYSVLNSGKYWLLFFFFFLNWAILTHHELCFKIKLWHSYAYRFGEWQ